MNPEPLKGKFSRLTNWMARNESCGGHAINIQLADKRDVASAVQWLKDKLDGRLIDIPDWEYEDLMKIIDEAFEDVIK